MITLILSLLFIALFVVFYLVLCLLDVRAERDEAIRAYNGAYALGHSAGMQAAGEQYRARVPWRDGWQAGYRRGYDAAVIELAGAISEAELLTREFNS